MISQQKMMALAAFTLTGVFGLAPTADASLITLSTHSSNATNPDDLDATFEFTLVGSTLTFTVTNDTFGAGAYNINELYFNAPAGVTMSFAGSPGWTYSNITGANGFGNFGFALIDGVNGDVNTISAGETVAFTFTITGGSPTENDFISVLSSIPPGMTQAIVAAKFVSGPGGNSAHGATVPVPGAALIMLAAFGGRRRRRRA